jgi:hypothetical protein
MQILIAFVVIGVIGVFAVVLVASAALIQCLPLLIVVLAVVGALRLWERRSHPRNTPWPPTPAARPRAIPPPAPPPRPTLPRPDGWALVPVWLNPAARQQHPVIDAEVISEQDHG